MKFHEKLQNLRKEKLMTQEELAEKLNVSRQAVSKWESNQTMPETDKIIQIANLFDVSLDYLLKVEEEKQNKNCLMHTNTIQFRTVNKMFIIGIAVFSLGFVGILIFCILSILHPINLTNGKVISSGFSDFLSANDMWIIFLICCLFSFLGLLLISKNIISNTLTKICCAYKRQNKIIKYGIVLCFFGILMFFPSLMLFFNQTVAAASKIEIIDQFTDRTVNIIPDIIKQPSFNPMILLILSLMVMVSGFIMLIIGTIKKAKNK